MTKPSDDLKTTTEKVATWLVAIGFLLLACVGFGQVDPLNSTEAKLLELEGQLTEFSRFAGQVRGLRSARENGTLERGQLEAAQRTAEALLRLSEHLDAEAMDLAISLSRNEYPVQLDTDALYAESVLNLQTIYWYFVQHLYDIVAGDLDVLEFDAPVNAADLLRDSRLFRALGNQSYRLDLLEAE